MKKYLFTSLILVATFISAVSFASSDEPDDKDIFAVPKTYAVQNRKYNLTNQLTVSFGYMPMDSFTKGYVLGGTYTTYFTDFTGWEVVNAQYVHSSKTGLQNQLLNEFNATPGQIPDFPDWITTTNLVYTPIYSKNLLFNRSVIWGDISFVGGGGVSKFKNNGIKPISDVGTYIRFFWTEKSSVRFDIREYVPFLKEGIKPFMMLGVAYTYQLGTQIKKSGEVDDYEKEFTK